MIDIKNITEQEIKNLLQRGYELPFDFNYLHAKQKTLRMAIETINAKINKNTQEPNDKKLLKKYKKDLENVTIDFEKIIHLIPNLLHETVPQGKGEYDNPVIKLGDQNFFNQNNKNHFEIGKPFGLDIDTGVHLAHTRFNLMRGKVAKLHRKLINLALDFYGEIGYEECYVPNLVNEETMFGTGQYPKFKDELFTTEGNQKLFLIPTGEVPLTNIVKNKTFNENEVKQNLMTHTPCFRKEVGTYGKDTKGIIRQHQFEKIELVKICLPENGLLEFNKMIVDIEDFIKQFGIPYRIIELCAGDIGFAGYKAYDFELWFPGEQKYREIATVTWCHDFQARRMNTKVKRANGTKELVHTLNGTGLAVGRVLAAILENNGI